MPTSERSLACVIDANVALKLYFEQAGSGKARALFALLESAADVRFYVPDLFYAECANAFSNYARLRAYTAAEARDDLSELLAFALHVVPTAELAAAALDISLHQRVTSYDACYVALARRIDALLITADEKLVQSLAGHGYPVQSLDNFVLPPWATAAE